jgi:hypothetical protein
MNLNAESLEASDSFIKKYCQETFDVHYEMRERGIILADWLEMQADLSNPLINITYVANYLRRLPYNKEFLRTPYWLIVRNKKLLDDNFLCQLDYKHNNSSLHVHHKTYNYHGYEAQHLECLSTLCASCHHQHSKGYRESEPTVNTSYLIDSLHNQYEELKKQKQLEADMRSICVSLTVEETYIPVADNITYNPYDLAITNLMLVGAQCSELYRYLKNIA